MTDTRSGTCAPLRSFILHPLPRCDSVRRGRAQQRRNMQKISAYILAFNEAEKIADAVASVLWADEILVVDSGSTDRTAEIAESLGARVVQIPFQGFGDLRNRAIAQCQHEWIFSLDSDERCTAEVRDEILAILASTSAHDAYLVPRRNYMRSEEHTSE